MPIRRLTPEDKPQILTLDNIIFSLVDPEGGWRESDFHHFFNEENCYIFCEDEHPEVVIGYIFATQNTDHTYISNLGTDVRTGKRGIGTALMEKVVLQKAERAKKNNRPFAVKLHVDVENEHALRFYQNLGFKEDGRDSHGIKMTLNTLPEKFKQNLPPPPRQTLIIRNVEGIQFSDLELALIDLDSNEHAPAAFNELIKLIRVNRRPLKLTELTHALTLFKHEEVRDYIYEVVKKNTGNHVIYHLNGISEYGITINSNIRYLTEKLEKIPQNTDFDLVYLGGGHGHPEAGLSNLSRQQLKNITDSLHAKSIQYSALVFGSCFSAGYLDLVQPLLKEHGVMLANSLECGGQNNFSLVMKWISSKQKEFFSKQQIRDSLTISEKFRADIKGILQGTIPPGERIRDEYNELQNSYRQIIQAVIDDLPEIELQVRTEELFNVDLEEFILDALVEIETLNREKIQEILVKYPRLNAYIQLIANKRGEDLVYSTLLTHLRLEPSSLVIATKKTVTMLNFNFVSEIPIISAADFKENYQTVRNKIKQLGGFLEIYELSANVHDVAARKQFNDLFTQAISSSQQEKAELRRREESEGRTEQQGIERQQEGVEQKHLAQQQKREEQEHQIEHEHRQNQQLYLNQLTLLANKIADLDGRGMLAAHTAAVKLYGELENAGTIYFSVKPTIRKYQTFHKSCTDSIREAHKVLDHHRDWSEFLGNLALGIGTLGIGLLIKGVINIANNRAFFFVHHTASCKTLNSFEQTINTVSVLVN